MKYKMENGVKKMVIEIKSHETLREQVYKALKEAVLNGDLKPGQKLSQEWLSRKMKVSRMPIREAIKMLEVDGLIESIPYKESRVVNFSSKDIGEIYTIRANLEGLAARMATNKIGEKDLQGLKKINEKMIDFLDQKKYKQLSLFNEKFHQNIYNRCGNERLCKIIKDLWNSIPKDTFWVINDRAEKSLKDHLKILRVLKDKDDKLVEELIREHIKNSEKDIKRFISDKDPKKRN